MKNALKGMPIWWIILALVLIATPIAVAWIVATNNIANVSLTVNEAEATIGVVSILIDGVGSGYDFQGSGTGTITITDAKELIAEFNVTGLDDTEKAALVSCTVSIGEDLNGDGDIDDPEELWGTIDALNPVPFTKALNEGTWDVFVLVEGTAAYPEEDTTILFDVTTEITTPL